VNELINPRVLAPLIIFVVFRGKVANQFFFSGATGLRVLLSG
jgi:hypothetical protein